MSEDNNVDRQLNELFQFCDSDSLTEEGLRELIERHGLTQHNIDDEYYDFFLQACGNERITEGIIRYVLERFPQAINAVDGYGQVALHYACGNKNVTPNIIQFLIDAAPESVHSMTDTGWTPLHYLCDDENLDDDDAAIQILKLIIEKYPEAVRHANSNGYLPIHLASENATFSFVQLLIDAAPDSVGRADNGGHTPLYILCNKQEVEETAVIQKILKLFIESYPAALRHATNNGNLPIHAAASLGRSPEFCRVLVDAAPDSVRIVNNQGSMPLHTLCGSGKVDEANAIPALKFLIEKYPEAVRHADNEGDLPIHIACESKSPEFCQVLIDAAPDSVHSGNNNNEYPVHCAIDGIFYGDNPITAAETVKLLLAFDPRVKLQKIQGRSLLYYACGGGYDDSDINDSRIETALQIIKTIYDALPEAIEENRIASDTQNFHQRIQAFINGELVYCRQAKDHRLITTPDDSGRLPLHTALQNNVRLGSIKLLVKGNPSAVRSFDDNGVIPLHVACQHHNSVNVVGYMVSLADVTLDTIDREGNTALHYACLGAKYDMITMLLEKYDAVSVSKLNAYKKLPIELLWENDAVEDRESVEYTDSIFRLLKAFPETLSGVGADVQPVLAAHSGESGIGKKRKFSHE